MTERVDIANIALSLLSVDPITSLEDDSREAEQMKLHYITARDATLEEHEWTFAIKRWIPTAHPDEPEWGWGNKFEIPSDILKVTDVQREFQGVPHFRDYNGEMRRNQAVHQIEGDFILTDEPTIYCRGIRRVEEEGRFSSQFAQALAAKLAVLTCLYLTESNSKLQGMQALYVSLIKAAKTRDGQQGSTQRLRHHRMSSAR